MILPTKAALINVKIPPEALLTQSPPCRHRITGLRVGNFSLTMPTQTALAAHAPLKNAPIGVVASGSLTRLAERVPILALPPLSPVAFLT